MINIVLCTDENYAPFCAVVILSTIINCGTSKDLKFFILTTGLKDDTKKKLNQMVLDKGAYIEIIEAKSKLAESVDLDRFGAGSVLRLSLDKYLPADAKKAIYLDCDLLVLGDISNLWKVDLALCSVGAVTDLCSPKSLIERPLQEHYFNSGVLLIDLDLWRKNEIGNKCIEYIKLNHAQLRYYDQDALNFVINKAWYSLDLSWNFQPTAYSAYEKNYDYLINRQTELASAIEFPQIVHFIGGIKPWHGNCVHPLQDLFIEFSKYSPWPINKSELLKELHFRERLRLYLKSFKRKKRLSKLNYKIPVIK